MKTKLTWRGLPVIITDWDLFSDEILPFPIRVKIYGEDEDGDFMHIWVSVEEVTRWEGDDTWH